MSYMHIKDLYRAKGILEFRHVWASEKIHGTSAHIFWTRDQTLQISSGGTTPDEQSEFMRNINTVELRQRFSRMGADVRVYGEAYGGSLMDMAATYGPQVRFVAFEVQQKGIWLSMPDAAAVVKELGLEFVAHELISTDLASLDAFLYADSVQAVRNGMGAGHKREGIVLHPPFEASFGDGERIVAKYKRPEFSETETVRPLDSEKLGVLEDAEAIAREWATSMRLAHVLDGLEKPYNISMTRKVIAAMTEDIMRESAGQIVDSKEARSAIARRTSELFKARL